MEASQRESFLSSPAARQWQQMEVVPHHGIALPIFSLLSEKSCGIGEYLNLIPLIEWCRTTGLNVIQLLPINDTGNDSGPYSSLTAFGLNPDYLSLDFLPFLENYPNLRQMLFDLKKSIPQTQRIDYSTVKKIKSHFLSLYYKEVGERLTAIADYNAFIQNNAFWLPAFALFKSLKMERQWTSWTEWPKEDFLELKKSHEREIHFHSTIQYLCFKQMKEVKDVATKNKIYIKGDIPILINRESADVWSQSSLFQLHYSAGAPPDMFAKEGQNWGFPLYHWENMEKENYTWWRERLGLANNFYHLYRIDHIVGFFRIWAIPAGAKGSDGKYVPEDYHQWIPQGTKIMKMMLEACDMLPIGEDLGNVPPEVRKRMSELGICGTKVIRWERNWEGDKRFIPYDRYPLDSMTTVSTHDSETLRQWWKNHPEEVKEFCHFMHWHYETELSLDRQKKILYDSHHTKSLFHINLLQEYFPLVSDLPWPNDDDERINIPGIVSDFNWSYRYKKSLEEIIANKELQSLFKELIH